MMKKMVSTIKTDRLNLSKFTSSEEFKLFYNSIKNDLNKVDAKGFSNFLIYS